MKTIELTTASKPLAGYTDDFTEDGVLLTSSDKPVAAVIPLTGDEDKEHLMLMLNPEFMRLVHSARQEFKAGKKLTLEEIRRQVLD